jgi:hypothetical protein
MGSAEGRRGATRRKMKVDPPPTPTRHYRPLAIPSLATSRSHSPAARARQAQRYDRSPGRPDPKWLFIHSPADENRRRRLPNQNKQDRTG